MRPATVLFLCLGLSAPVVAQELPKPIEAGTKALDALVARGVAAGGMREFRDARTGGATLVLMDTAKLNQTVADARLGESDALVARWHEAPASKRAVEALLRAVGESAGDGLADAFADFFEGVRLRGRDQPSQGPWPTAWPQPTSSTGCECQPRRPAVAR